ncbi:MAG TPA: A/G-specific adenine glycosylase [Polyangia bacterium]|nr:A/G-specific adenine glycosylase [Polyangia bacterium]
MTAIARPLLRWYDRAKRDLPWRRDPSPYKTLVSEFMLQQTVVATVEPYFGRFIARFPDLASLAAAGDDEVTALWSGLGYYARARNLRRAAAAVVADHGGAIPATETGLRALPGIGPYTAAAVAAIAFDARAFALDGNTMRVLARLGAERRPVDRPATRAALHARGLAEVPRRRAGDFNQALMELGALVCTPRNPDCAACPLAAGCRARAEGQADQLPRKRPRAARPVVRIVCACITDGARVLVIRRGRGLLAGTWALPEAIDRGARLRPAIARGLAEAAGVRVAGVAYRGAVRHVFTHRDVTAELFRVDVDRPPRRPPASDDRRWVSPHALVALGVSTFARKTVNLGFGRLEK